VRYQTLFALAVSVGSINPALVSQQAKLSERAAPTVTSAKDGIFAAFLTHSLVGLGDYHGLAQEEDFFAALIRDPRFAKEVGNVVVEFGDAAQQETIDRYVAGEDVPYAQLRKVWADTVGWIPTVTALGYINFYAEVRAVNLALPAPQRIHVWLGDPPFDWSKVKTKADLSKIPTDAERDQFPADLIKVQILAKKKKALVIYGTFHFYGQASLKTLVEQRSPGAFFVVTPYTGFNERSCSEAFEKTVNHWSHEALATPLRDTTLQDQIHPAGCHFVSAPDFSFQPGETEAQKAKEMADMEDQSSGVAGDALLFLGPAAGLTQSPLAPDLYIDGDFLKEINRRFFIMGGGPITWPTVRDNPMSPQFIRSYGDSSVGEAK
jgi:hypothetical protein